MLIADPCYACERDDHDSAFRLALRIRVRPGTYDAFVLTTKFPRIGDRVSYVLIALRDPTIPTGRKFAWYDPIGVLGVDTGRLGFYDAVRYPENEHHAIYDRTRYRTTIDGNLGVVSSTGLGDGCYDVFAARYQGHVVALLGAFGNDDDDLGEILRYFEPVAPFLAARPKGDPMAREFNPPTGWIGSYTTRLAWQKVIELAVNGIETAELNAASMLALGREPNQHDVANEREHLAAAMRFLYTELRDELHYTEEQIDNHYAPLASAVDDYLEASRRLFYIAINTLDDDKNHLVVREVVSEDERLQRVDRVYEAERRLDMHLLALFNAGMRATGTYAPAPANWKTDPKIIQLRK
jgi:hypothetical protein